MKTGKLFWGILFVTLGTIGLLDYFGIDARIDLDSEVVIPILLVLLGVALLFKNLGIKYFFIILASIISAFALYDIFWDHARFDCDDEDNINIEIYEDANLHSIELSDSIKLAKLELSTLGNEIFFNENNDDGELIQFEQKGNLRYKTHNFTENGIANIKINPETISSENADDDDSELKLSLSTRIDWEINVNSGASNLEMNLVHVPVAKFEIKSAVSNIDITLGSLQKYSNLMIDAAASEIIINLPKETGCLIESKSIFLEKDLPNFSKFDENSFTSQNYDKSKNKVKIDLKSAINRIEVKFY